MGGSLQQLTKNLLASGRSKFENLLQYFATHSDLSVDLLLQKEAYPYDYMNCWERFDETALPPRDKFFNKLRDEEFSEEDYGHAQKVDFIK